MKAWEIWSYQPAGWPEAHPAVIVSGPARVTHKPELNIIMCSTKEATRPPLPSEVILEKRPARKQGRVPASKAMSPLFRAASAALFHQQFLQVG
jgi:hypothetical protein